MTQRPQYTIRERQSETVDGRDDAEGFCRGSNTPTSGLGSRGKTGHLQYSPLLPIAKRMNVCWRRSSPSTAGAPLTCLADGGQHP